METYYDNIQQARLSLLLAMKQAIRLLPDYIIRRHWIASKHTPSPWRSVESWYRQQTAIDTDVLHTLTDLALMDEASSCLMTIAAPNSTSLPDLKLARTKRTA